MLRKLRIALAIIFGLFILLLFLDFTGSVHSLFGWMAKGQFLPAVLALNVGVIVFWIVATLLLGRVYCSVICPLGIFQDVVSWLSGKRKTRKYRFTYSKSVSWLRYVMLGVLIVTLVMEVSSIVVFLDPYSAFGRMVSNLFVPIYQWANNLLAYAAERVDSYAFYSVEVWMRGLTVLLIATATFVLLMVLAWRNGRTYCNTICPVGTMLGFLSRYSLLRPVINTEKCTGCGLCAKGCKSSCINSKEHQIDYSRCVVCLDCMENCKQGAIEYKRRLKETELKQKTTVDESRRSMLAISAALLASSTLKAQEKTVDGGLAFIEDKKIPMRQTKIVPPGANGIRHFAAHCTGCQLCVSVCPSQVLRPSTDLLTLMQPEVSYERGYCRPECNRCSEVCPAGAIVPIALADKSSTQVGHAVWIEKNCVVLTDGVACGNCARHCLSGAITMVLSDPEDENSVKIPVVNEERCIGCGACENLCPARPFSAIYVEGHQMHKTI